MSIFAGLFLTLPQSAQKRSQASGQEPPGQQASVLPAWLLAHNSTLLDSTALEFPGSEDTCFLTLRIYPPTCPVPLLIFFLQDKSLGLNQTRVLCTLLGGSRLSLACDPGLWSCVGRFPLFHSCPDIESIRWQRCGHIGPGHQHS